MSVDVIRECVYLCPFCYEKHQTDIESQTHIANCRPGEPANCSLKVVTKESHLCIKCVEWFDRPNDCFLHSLTCTGRLARDLRDAATMVTENDIHAPPQLKAEPDDLDYLVIASTSRVPTPPTRISKEFGVTRQGKRKAITQQSGDITVMLNIGKHVTGVTNAVQHRNFKQKPFLLIDGYKLEADRKFSSSPISIINPKLVQWRCRHNECNVTCQTDGEELIRIDNLPHLHLKWQRKISKSHVIVGKALEKYDLCWIRPYANDKRINDALIIDGYMMSRADKRPGDDVWYWICSMHVREKCNARAATQHNKLVSLHNYPHCHAPEKYVEQKWKLYTAIDDVVKDYPLASNKEIIDMARHRLPHISIEQQPLYRNLSALVYNRRLVHHPWTAKPKCPIVEGEELTQYSYSYEQGSRGGQVLVINGYWHYKCAKRKEIQKPNSLIKWVCEFTKNYKQRNMSEPLCWARATTKNGELVRISELPHTHPPRVEPLPGATTNYRNMLNNYIKPIDSNNELIDEFSLFQSL